MKMTFAGCGGAFTTADYYQSNVLVTADSGKKLLIDCGGDARFSLGELGITNEAVGCEIDAVYISHCHADHIGGLEWLGFCSFFHPDGPRPKLYVVDEILSDLWRSLQSGMQSHEGQVLTLHSFFDVHALPINDSFLWEGIAFTPIQTIHVMNGMGIVDSFGLLIRPSDEMIFFTTDTQFCPRPMERFYDEAAVIFHDCESASYHSGVHAHYDDLVTLPAEIKKKMWLYHYQPNPPQNAVADGFLGFVVKGQTFEFPEK